MAVRSSTTHPGIFHDARLLPRFDAKLVVANKIKYQKNKANSQQPIAKSPTMAVCSSTIHRRAFFTMHAYYHVLTPNWSCKQNKISKNKANSQQPIAKSQKNIIFVGTKKP